MSTVQEQLAIITDHEMMVKLCMLNVNDYEQIKVRLMAGHYREAVSYLRYDAIDKMPMLEGAMFYVGLVRKFEGLDTKGVY